MQTAARPASRPAVRHGTTLPSEHDSSQTTLKEVVDPDNIPVDS